MKIFYFICFSFFIFHISSQCVDSQCFNCSIAPATCEMCNPNYLLNSGSTCEQCLISATHHCESCVQTGSCDSCVVNYLLNSLGNCELCAPGAAHKCEICSKKNECDSCSPGFLLNSSHLCEQCSLNASHNCTTCSAVNKCSICQLNWLVNVNDECELCSNYSSHHCANCHSTPEMCDLCQSSYLKNALGKCELCSPSASHKCVNCMEEGKCSQCEAGYFLNENYTCELCGPLASHGCNQCVTQGICTVCNSLSLLTQNKCDKCQINTLSDHKCQLCPSIGVCQDCLLNYLPNSLGKCELCSEIASHKCTLCSNNQTKCDFCNPNYVTNNVGVCELCSGTATHKCTSCSNSVCTECKATYLVNAEKICELCDGAASHRCTLCATQGICTQCQPQYLLNDNGICEMCNVSSTHKCTKCSAQGICSECHPNYRLNSLGKCELCSSTATHKCENCPNINICTSCQSNYFLKDDNTCESCSPTASHKCTSCPLVGNCSSCLENYLIGTNGRCELCSAIASHKCVSCPTADKCSGCQFNNLPDFNGKCETCDYYNNITSSISHNCASCPNYDICQYCKPNYSLNSTGQCELCAPLSSHKCLQCSYNGFCNQCEANYYPSNLGKCELCSLTATHKCTTCSTGNCTDCATNYLLNNWGSCEICIINASHHCISCSNGGICNKCEDSYFLNATTKQCQSCSLNSNTFCDKCTDSGSCYSCFPGYLMNSQRICEYCQESASHGCRSCPSSTCQTCNNNSVLKNGDCFDCKQFFPNCKSCNQTSCQICEEGYYYKNGGCLIQKFARPIMDGMIGQFYNFFNKKCLISTNLEQAGCRAENLDYFVDCNSEATSETLFKVKKSSKSDYYLISPLKNSTLNLYSNCSCSCMENKADFVLAMQPKTNLDFFDCPDVKPLLTCKSMDDVHIFENYTVLDALTNTHRCRDSFVNQTSEWNLQFINNSLSFGNSRRGFLFENGGYPNMCLQYMKEDNITKKNYAILNDCKNYDYDYMFGFNIVDIREINNQITTKLNGESDTIKIEWSNPTNYSPVSYIIYYYDNYIDFNTYICGSDKPLSPIIFDFKYSATGELTVSLNITINDLIRCGVRTYIDLQYITFDLKIITYYSDNKIAYVDNYHIKFQRTAQFGNYTYVGYTNDSQTIDNQIQDNKNSTSYVNVTDKLTLNISTLIEKQYLQKDLTQSMVINYNSVNKFSLNLMNSVIIMTSTNSTFYINATFDNSTLNQIKINFSLETLPSNYYTMGFSIFFQLVNVTSRILAQTTGTEPKSFSTTYSTPSVIFVGKDEEIKKKIAEAAEELVDEEKNTQVIIIAVLSSVLGSLVLAIGSYLIYRKYKNIKIGPKNKYDNAKFVNKPENIPENESQLPDRSSIFIRE